MKRLLATLYICMIAVLAAPSLFACQDCPDSVNCITMDGGHRFCEFFQGGGCVGKGTCPQLAASLQAEYRVAAVRVIEQGKPLPQAQKAPAPVRLAAR